MGSPEGCRISPAYVPAATLRVASRSYPLRVPMGNQCRDPSTLRISLRRRRSCIFRVVERDASTAARAASFRSTRFRAAEPLLPIRAVIDRSENNRRCRSRHLSQEASQAGPAVLRSPSLHVRARREPRCIVSPSIMALVLLRVRRKRRIGSRSHDRSAGERKALPVRTLEDVVALSSFLLEKPVEITTRGGEKPGPSHSASFHASWRHYIPPLDP